MSALEDVKRALRALGGEGKLEDIFREYSKLNSNPLRTTVRNTIYQHSSDSKFYQKNGDFFRSVGGSPVNGKRSGVWGLRGYKRILPVPAIDEEAETAPNRQAVEVNRIIRDSPLVMEIKKLVGNHCQLCDERIILRDGREYSEAHHIKPLGNPYSGPDIRENILVVCPNCHVKCDYRIIPLSYSSIKNNLQDIGEEYISFHNELFHSNAE